jgi:hypothetical protein
VSVRLAVGPQVIVPDLATYDRGTILRVLNSWAVERHVLKFASLVAWRKLYQTLLDQGRIVQLQYGVSQQGRLIRQPSERRYVAAIEVDAGSSNMSQYGPVVTLTTVDPLFLLSISDRTRAMTGTGTELLDQLAQPYDLPVRAEPAPRKLALVQSFQDDFEFLQARLRPRLVSTAGQAGYLFYCRANQLFVHTPAWSEARAWQTSIGTTVPVADFAVLDNLGAAESAGRGSVKLTAYLPLTGATGQAESDAELAAKFAAATWPYNQRQLATAHIGQNGPDDELALIQDRHTTARYGSAGARLRVVNEPAIWVGDRVDLATPGDDPGQGTYLVSRIDGEISSNNLQSVITLTRGETTAVGTAPGQALPAPRNVNPNAVRVLSPA